MAQSSLSHRREDGNSLLNAKPGRFGLWSYLGTGGKPTERQLMTTCGVHWQRFPSRHRLRRLLKNANANSDLNTDANADQGDAPDSNSGSVYWDKLTVPLQAT